MKELPFDLAAAKPAETDRVTETMNGELATAKLWRGEHQDRFIVSEECRVPVRFDLSHRVCVFICIDSVAGQNCPRRECCGQPCT